MSNKISFLLTIAADNYNVSKDADCMAANPGLDLALDTIPSNHDINPYLPFLKKESNIVVLGTIPDRSMKGTL